MPWCAEWTVQFGTPMNDEADAVALDVAGVYAVGSTAGAFKEQTSAGHNDAFVRSFDHDGVLGTTVQFGTARRDEAYWAIVDGGVLAVVGMTTGAFEGQTRAGKSDGFLARLDLT